MLGWLNWLMPMSWLVVGLGILFYVVSFLLHAVTGGKVQYLRIQQVGADWKTGTFFIARDLGIPVVPVTAIGAYDMMRKGSLIMRPAKVTMYLDEPIETAGLSDDEVVALAARVQAIVGERLETTSLEVLEAVARGNLRVYENEVTRLANRFVERLETTWKSA